MEIRLAVKSDVNEVVELYKRSQAFTQLPNPLLIPPDELGDHLYSREAIKRFVAVRAGRIVGHTLIEKPNPAHIPIWRQRYGESNPLNLIEMGGAFVEPQLMRQGIWTALLEHSLDAIRAMNTIPVSATWVQSEHVKRTFESHGGADVGQQQTALGNVSLYVF